MIEERSLTSYLIIWKTTKIIKGGNIMSKSNSFKKSRKLALGIAVAMGCSMASVAFADQTITEPIIGPDNLPFSENVNV